jgi:hypothetical protein
MRHFRARHAGCIAVRRMNGARMLSSFARSCGAAALVTLLGCGSSIGSAELARTDTSATNAEGPSELATDDVDLGYLSEPYQAAEIRAVVAGPPGTRIVVEVCDDLKSTRTLTIAPQTSMQTCTGARVDLYEARGDDALEELHWEATVGTVEVAYDKEDQTATLTLHTAMSPRVVFADLAASGTFDLAGDISIESL